MRKDQFHKDKKTTNDPLQAQRLNTLIPELRDHIGRRLPTYMAPSRYMLLDRLPVTPNRKIDYHSLPEPEPTILDRGHRHTLPSSPLETLLARIWTELLGIDEIGVHDSFFALGGNSLLGIRALTRLENETGIRSPVSLLFESPTIAELAIRLLTETMDREP